MLQIHSLGRYSYRRWLDAKMKESSLVPELTLMARRLHKKDWTINFKKTERWLSGW